MPYKVEQSQRIFRLQRSLKAKQRALHELKQERAHLASREMLLSATCKVLQMMMQRRAVLAEALHTDVSLGSAACDEPPRLDQSGIHDPWVEQDYQLTEGTQIPPLSRLVSDSSSRHDTLSRSPVALDAASNSAWDSKGDLHDLIAPAQDPLHYLRELVLASTGTHPGACSSPAPNPVLDPASISVDELRIYYCQIKDQLAAHMSCLEQVLTVDSSSSDSGGVLSKQEIEHQGAVKEILYRYLHLINDIMLYNNFHVLLEFYSTDVVEGNVLENETQVHEQVLPDIHLNQQQTGNILTCYSFLSSLYEPVTNHRSQLLQQKHPLHQIHHPTSSSGDVPWFAEPDASHLPFQRQRSVQQQQQRHWKHQQQHQQYLNTLRINMGKEVTITHIAAFTLWGCLSWSQAAKLILACYPVPANPIVLASVMQQLDNERAQRKQATKR